MNDMTLLRRKSKKDDEVIDSLWENYIKARIEIDELHEKYRWRKQSEEPAPEGGYVLICNRGCDIHGYTFPRISRSKQTYPAEYWRPLDLPEEESK